MRNEFIIPEAQGIRFTPNTFYQQPAGSLFSKIEAPYNRNYFNTEHELEILSNRRNDLQLYPFHFGAKENYVAKHLRRGESVTIACRCLKSINNINLYLQAILANGDKIFIDTAKTDFYDDSNFVEIYDAQITGFQNENYNYSYIYFLTGQKISFTEATQHYLLGELNTNILNAHNFKATFDNSNNFEIGAFVDKIYLQDLGVWALKFNKTFNPTIYTSGTLQITFKRSNFGFMSAFSFSLPDILLKKCFKLQVLSSAETPNPLGYLGYQVAWTSELLTYKIDISQAIKLQYKDAGQPFLIDYRNTAIEHYIYINADNFDILPRGENEQYESDRGRLQRFTHNYQRRFLLQIENQTRQAVDTLAIAFRMSDVKLNNKGFTIDLETLEVEKIEKTMLFNLSVEVVENELQGVFSKNYDFNNMAYLPPIPQLPELPEPSEPPDFYLNIDNENKLLIDDTKLLII